MEHHRIGAPNLMPSFYAIDFEVPEYVDQPIAILLAAVAKPHVANVAVHLVVKIADSDTETEMKIE